MRTCPPSSHSCHLHPSIPTSCPTHLPHIAATGEAGKLPEVAVLKDGWEGWVKLYAGEEGLVEPVDVAK